MVDSALVLEDFKPPENLRFFVLLLELTIQHVIGITEVLKSLVSINFGVSLETIRYFPTHLNLIQAYKQ